MSQSKRTKHVAYHHKRSAPSSGFASFNTDRFLFADNETKFDNIFSTRGIIPGRYIQFEELNNPALLTAFEAQGWEDFAKLKTPVYPEMICEFYSNLVLDSSDPNELKITSYLRKTHISLIETDLANLLHVPHKGARISQSAEWPGGDVPSIDELFVRICETPPDGRNVKFLTPTGRILHLFIRYNLMPSASHMTDLTNMDIILLFNLLNSQPISLPYLILNHMASKLRSKHSSLGYGMVIGLILSSFNCNPSPADHPMHQDPSNSSFGLSALHRLGIIPDDSGNWVRVGGEVGIAAASRPSHRRRAPPPTTETGSSSATSTVDTAAMMEFFSEKFTTMTTFMHAEFTGIHGEVAAMNGRVTALDQKVTLIEKRQQDFHLELINQIKHIDDKSEDEAAEATEDDGDAAD